MNSTIRFLRINSYRKPIGFLDTQMGYGVHDALVRRGIAEWVNTEVPPMQAAVISQPVAASAAAVSVQGTETHERKPRRFSTKEE